MTENTRYEILSMLKTEFPGLEHRLDYIYWQDPLFRQIAREYHECIRKQERVIDASSKLYMSYTDTIRELKEELLEHLNEPIKKKV
jgi:hypothetical protein